jgi:hypothetical protein
MLPACGWPSSAPAFVHASPPCLLHPAHPARPPPSQHDLAARCCRCWGKQIGAAGKAHGARFPYQGPAKNDVWHEVMMLNRHYMHPAPGYTCPYEPPQCQDLQDLEQLEQQQHEDDEIAQRQAAAFAEVATADEDELLDAAFKSMANKDLDRGGIDAEWKSLQAEMGGGDARGFQK